MDVLKPQAPDVASTLNPGASFPTYSATPVAEPLTDSLKPKKSHKLLITLLVLLVIIIAGGVWAYPMISSHAVISSLEKIDNAPKISGKLSVSLISDDQKLASSAASVYGEIDRSQSSDWPMRFVFDVKSPLFSEEGELRIIEQVLYGKSNAMNAAFASGSGFPASLWYSLKFETLKLLAKNSGSSPYGLDSILSRERPLIPVTSLSEGYKILRDAGVIGEPKFKRIEKKNGVYVRTYQFMIDNDKLADHLVTNLSQKFPELASSIESAKTVARKQMENLDITPVTASVSLFGGEIREVTLGVSVSEKADVMTFGVNGLNLLFEHDPTNSSFAIIAPEGVLPLDTVMLQNLGNAELKAQHARARSSLSSIRPSLEIYYDGSSSYAGGCMSSQVVQFGTEIKNSGFVFTCRTSAKAYLIAATGFDPATMATSSICYDSTGLSKTLPKLSPGFVCK